MNRSAKDNLANAPLYEAQPMSGAEGNAAIWENASNREIINPRKPFPESTFFQAIKQRRATAGERWPGEKQVNAHFADEATGFDSACSGSSGTENSRGGSVDRERGGPKRKRATTPRAIPIAARRANWTIRLFLGMPRFC
jgi:hypothetical protein